MEAIYYLDDLGNNSEIRPIPDELREQAEALRATMVERVAEVDDSLTEKFLEDGVITVDEITEGLRVATITGKLVPVLCGSALKNKGVQRDRKSVV